MCACAPLVLSFRSLPSWSSACYTSRENRPWQNLMKLMHRSSASNGEGNINMFVFCPTDFFCNQLSYGWFQKKLVRHNPNIWIFIHTPQRKFRPSKLHAKVATWSVTEQYCTILHVLKLTYFGTLFTSMCNIPPHTDLFSIFRSHLWNFLRLQANNWPNHTGWEWTLNQIFFCCFKLIHNNEQIAGLVHHHNLKNPGFSRTFLCFFQEFSRGI